MAVELIIATFEGSENEAGEFMGRLRELENQNEITVAGATAISRPVDGEAQLEHLHEKGKKRGGTYGALTGALAGLLVGGPIVGAIGAVAGGVGGSAISDITDHGIPESLVDDIRDGLNPGSSALLVYLDQQWTAMAISRLNEAGATVTHEPVSLKQTEPRSASG
jgi:uncharacterized membrane protein